MRKMCYHDRVLPLETGIIDEFPKYEGRDVVVRSEKTTSS